MDKQTRDWFDASIIQEILRRKAVWIHGCYKAILPPELYDLAKADNQLPRVTEWARNAGYSWHEMRGTAGGETQLRRAGLVVAYFRPILVGSGATAQMDFKAEILGKAIGFKEDDVLIHQN